MSIVALVDEADKREIIAEARYIRSEQSAYGNVAFTITQCQNSVNPVMLHFGQ